MKRLNIDIETYSDRDLQKSGVYGYVDSPEFEILLFGYAVDGGKVSVVDLASGEMLSDQILKALTDPSVLKIAFNAQFERTCIGHFLGKKLDPREWRCPFTLGFLDRLQGWALCLVLRSRS